MAAGCLTHMLTLSQRLNERTDAQTVSTIFPNDSFEAMRL